MISNSILKYSPLSMSLARRRVNGLDLSHRRDPVEYLCMSGVDAILSGGEPVAVQRGVLGDLVGTVIAHANVELRQYRRRLRAQARPVETGPFLHGIGGCLHSLHDGAIALKRGLDDAAIAVPQSTMEAQRGPRFRPVRRRAMRCVGGICRPEVRLGRFCP